MNSPWDFGPDFDDETELLGQFERLHWSEQNRVMAKLALIEYQTDETGEIILWHPGPPDEDQEVFEPFYDYHAVRTLEEAVRETYYDHVHAVRFTSEINNDAKQVLVEWFAIQWPDGDEGKAVEREIAAACMGLDSGELKTRSFCAVLAAMKGERLRREGKVFKVKT